MTKAELIHALFGYDDDTEVVVYTDGRDVPIARIKAIKTADVSGASNKYEEKVNLRLEVE